MIWTVAYNKPTRSWSSGGTEADYQRPHWDIFEVEAKHRDEAQRKAMELRRKHRALPARQRELLNELLADIFDPKEPAADPLKVAIDLNDEDLRPADGLVKKGLLTLEDGRIARITKMALNFREEG